MAKVMTKEALDCKRWNQQIAAISGPVQLTSEWAAFVQAKDNVLPFFFESTEKAAAYSIFYVARSQRWPLSRWPSAFADCLPIGPGSSPCLSEIERALGKFGVVEFQQNSFAFDRSSPLDLASIGFSTLARLEFGLSLHDGPESAWQRFRPTLRNDLRRFERSGIVCTLRNDIGVVDLLHAIERATTIRHKTQGKDVQSMGRGVFELLWTHLIQPGRARAYIAEQGGTPLAFVVMGAVGEQAYYLYGGAMLDALKLNAPKGLLWHAIQAEYEQGVRHLNLGGMPASASAPESVDHGLYKFKTAFGATEIRCLSGRKVLRPATLTTLSCLRQIATRLRAG